jgi:hypothetical protein
MQEPPEDREPFRIIVGPASFEVRDGLVTSSVNEPGITASGTIPAEGMASSPADWAAPAEAAEGTHVLMDGQVVEALPESDGSVAVTVRSGLMLDETLMAPMAPQNVTPQDIVYAAARSAGFSTDKIDIHGLDVLPVEPMWVLAPVGGLRVEATMRVGVVEFIDAPAGQGMLGRFSPPLEPVFIESLQDVSAFARVAVGACTLYDAEQEGLTLIDTAAAWLTTRLRYTWSHAPDGSLEHYERAPTLMAVARREGVGVLAVEGQRRWWRKGATVGRGSGEFTLAPGVRWMEPALPAEVAPGDRQSLFALQRAATASDPVQRVAALWEAIEFYVGDRNPPRRFTRSEITAIVSRAVEGLSGDQAQRVKEVLSAFLNQPPIIARLEHALGDEGVPVTDDDLALLRRLRNERNLALHGSTAAPEHEEIDRGLAVLSRALTTRLHRARDSRA